MHLVFAPTTGRNSNSDDDTNSAAQRWLRESGKAGAGKREILFGWNLHITRVSRFRFVDAIFPQHIPYVRLGWLGLLEFQQEFLLCDFCCTSSAHIHIDTLHTHKLWIRKGCATFTYQMLKEEAKAAAVAERRNRENLPYNQCANACFRDDISDCIDPIHCLHDVYFIFYISDFECSLRRVRVRLCVCVFGLSALQWCRVLLSETEMWDANCITI